MSENKKRSDYLTKREINEILSVGMKRRHVTRAQAKKLMDILGIEEHPERKTRGACKHFIVTECAVNTVTVMARANELGLSALEKTPKRLLVKHLSSPFIGESSYHECELTGQRCPFWLWQEDDNRVRHPVCGRQAEACALPGYVKGHPEKNITDDTMEIISGLKGCTGRDCQSRSWFSENCTGCSLQAALLKAMYLTKCYRDKKRKENKCL